MQKKETAIEVKVGALVLFSVALLVAFVIVLGDFSFDDGFQVKVDFDNAAGLKPGADVMISGIKVGSVDKLEFLAGQADVTPAMGQAPYSGAMVRAHLTVDPEMAYALRVDSQYYITTQGVLGEKYVEVTTNNLKSQAISEGATVRGVDPPRMELLLAKGADVLERIADLLVDEDVPINQLLANLNNLVVHADEMLVANKDTVTAVMKNVETASEDLPEITEAVKVGLADGEDLAATVRHARSLTANLDQRTPALLNTAGRTLARAESVATHVDEITTSRRPRIEGAIDNLHAASTDVLKITSDVSATTDDVRVMVGQIKAGEGTIGGLMTDEEIYDDLKEMLRELKRRPWKIIWKE